MISAIIPAHNEEERLPSTISAIRSIPEVDEIIVVNDGSTDGTTAAARATGACVVTLPQNRGKGAAVAEGVQKAKGDILLLADADLGESAVELRSLIGPLLQDEADMTIATFPVIPGKGGGMGFVVRLGRRGIHEATGHYMDAPLSGQRALRRRLLDAAGGFAPGFGMEVALTIDAIRAGFRVVEIPTTMTHRVTGRDMKSMLHRIRQYRAVRDALRKRL